MPTWRTSTTSPTGLADLGPQLGAVLALDLLRLGAVGRQRGAHASAGSRPRCPRCGAPRRRAQLQPAAAVGELDLLDLTLRAGLQLDLHAGHRGMRSAPRSSRSCRSSLGASVTSYGPNSGTAVGARRPAASPSGRPEVRGPSGRPHRAGRRRADPRSRDVARRSPLLLLCRVDAATRGARVCTPVEARRWNRGRRAARRSPTAHPPRGSLPAPPVARQAARSDHPGAIVAVCDADRG